MNPPTAKYSAMLYALSAEIDSDDGCVTASAAEVAFAAQRLDELTVENQGLRHIFKEARSLLAEFSDALPSDESMLAEGKAPGPLVVRIRTLLERTEDIL
jgi:hypothetical protein